MISTLDVRTNRRLKWLEAEMDHIKERIAKIEVGVTPVDPPGGGRL